MHKGFTLIETIIYVALFALIVGGGLAGAWQLIEGGGRDLGRIVVEGEGNFLLQKMLWALEGSPTSITASAEHLEFHNNDEDFVFDVADGEMTLDSVPLSSNNVVVSDASFVRTAAAGGVPEHISISFSVNDRPFGPAITYVR